MVLRIGDDSRKWWLLVAMGVAGGLIQLDETVVGVALPTIRRDLGMTAVASHWAINAYFLVFAGMAAAAGKAGDLFGLRNVFLVGLIVFGLASLAAGAAPSGDVLIAARAVQGVGAAVIFPLSIAMIMRVFPENQRGMAMGVVAAIGTSFLVAGPLVGGFFTEIVSWRWIFWINLPIVFLAMPIVLVAWRQPPADASGVRIDLSGFVTLVVGLCLVIFAVMQGAVWGWTQPGIAVPLVGGVLLLAFFVFFERRRDEPLIDVALFGNATVSACNLVVFSGQFGKIAVVVFVALLLQDHLGMSPLMSGVALLTAVAATPFAAAVAGRTADRYGARRPALIALLLGICAMTWIGVVSAMDSFALLVPGLLVWGAIVPFLYMPTQRAIMNAVPPEAHGQTSGVTMTTRLLGGTFGMAVSGTLLTSTGSFQVVFLFAAALLVVAFAVGLVAIERQEAAE